MENPKILRTPLAQRCNRNYQQLKKYLVFMEKLELIELQERDTKVYTKITEYGKKVFKNTKH